MGRGLELPYRLTRLRRGRLDKSSVSLFLISPLNIIIIIIQNRYSGMKKYDYGLAIWLTCPMLWNWIQELRNLRPQDNGAQKAEFEGLLWVRLPEGGQ